MEDPLIAVSGMYPHLSPPPFFVIGCPLVYMLLPLSEIIHMVITYWSWRFSIPFYWYLIPDGPISWVNQSYRFITVIFLFP